MIVSHKHKFIFIHIPKCAGSSITQSIRDHLGYKLDLSDAKKEDFLYFQNCYGNSNDLQQHDEYAVIKKYFKKKNWNIDEYFKFAFVRNPWARRVSQFEYAKRMYKEKKHEWTFQWKDLSFKQHLEKNTDCQLNWISKEAYPLGSSGKHEIAIDFIGKTENIQNDFNVVCEKINFPKIKLPNKNKTEHKDYTEYYGWKEKQIINNTCKRDIEYFGYKFDEQT
tara:strand:- start:217 stop:882 length:666 start_codon:yes stop_codon:yes gene_type:complete